mgnify:CR=1 FL=1
MLAGWSADKLARAVLLQGVALLEGHPALHHPLPAGTVLYCTVLYRPSTIHYLQVLYCTVLSTIHYLQASWAYGPDFQLFQYRADSYLQQARAKCQLQGSSWKG